MPVTFGTPGSALDTSAPYSITLTAPAAVGDVVFATALAGEWSSATPDARTLTDPTEPGWTRLHREEFQLYPTVPAEADRRMVVGAWWKVATSTTETATITLTGGALSGRLTGGAVAASGAVPNLLTQASTRRENVDLGVGSTPWSPTIPPIRTGQVGFLIYQVWGANNFPTPSGDGHVGWSFGPDLVTTFGGQRMLYVEGDDPPIVWPNQNINAMVTIAVFGTPEGGGWQLGSVGWGPA